MNYLIAETSVLLLLSGALGFLACRWWFVMRFQDRSEDFYQQQKQLELIRAKNEAHVAQVSALQEENKALRGKLGLRQKETALLKEDTDLGQRSIRMLSERFEKEKAVLLAQIKKLEDALYEKE